MCGIAGFLTGATAPDAELSAMARCMANTLTHRGPDDGGVWSDASAGVALAHRRLSILDLSPAGHQPMASPSGRYVLAFNGEIYNHRDLRARLGGMSWRGHSDTETMLAAFEAWGVERTLRQSVGMYAFALWDCRQRTITLARDRLGEKPLYYGWCGDSFLFGSELKALHAHPDWCSEVSRGALSSFMRYGYVPAPHSIWRGISKLLPGTFLTISADAPGGVLPTPVFYWRARDVAMADRRPEFDDAQASHELDALLRDAIGGQMVADVPLGAFLSGGVDSSVIVALMQAQSTRPVRTFSIGFAEDDYNEAVHAKAVAAHLGTDHTELYLSPGDALGVIPRLPDMYDEPFGDSSQIPTHLVAAMARKCVAVSLSGDGGDELFGGYNRYFLGSAMWRGISPVPQAVRHGASNALSALSPMTWDRIGRMLPHRLRQPMLGDRVHKLASVLGASTSDEVYRWLVSHEREPGSLVVGASDLPLWADAEAASFSRTDVAERMMFSDLVSYLTDDILCKVDRAAMATSLETRVPLLDHRVVEFALKLPRSMKIRNRQGKWLLRQVLYRYVPKELIERPKQGFGIPLDAWLRGPLREWAETLLDERRLRREGYLQPGPIRQKWQEHLSGRRNWQHWLWNILMFQAWRERWL